MKKTYECMLVLDNRQVREGWEPLKESVTGLFAKYDAEVMSARRWDERRLAYPIRGQSRGTYLLVYYSGETENNPAIRRELELSESVLRYMTTTCEEVPGEAYEPEAEFDVSSLADDPPREKAADADKAKEGEAKEREAKEGEAKATEGDAAEGKSTEADAPAEGKSTEGDAPAEGAADDTAATEASSTDETTEAADAETEEKAK